MEMFKVKKLPEKEFLQKSYLYQCILVSIYMLTYVLYFYFEGDECGKANEFSRDKIQLIIFQLGSVLFQIEMRRANLIISE